MYERNASFCVLFAFVLLVKYIRLMTHYGILSRYTFAVSAFDRVSYPLPLALFLFLPLYCVGAQLVTVDEGIKVRLRVHVVVFCKNPTRTF